MILGYWRRRRRRRLLQQPVSAGWHALLQRNVAMYRRLDDDERRRLDDAGRIFLAEKNFEGCAGQIIDDTVRFCIAGQACIMVLGLPDCYFDHVRTVLVYPGEYRATDKRFRPQEISDRLGEAHFRGPVVLSWRDALLGMRHPAERPNVVVHEFAHQLDMMAGIVDGGGALGTRQQRDRWRAILWHEYEHLVHESVRGRATLLDQYGTESPAEFFAVATECFFGRPLALRRRHPDLYAVLGACYRLDPARWFTAEPEPAGNDTSALADGHRWDGTTDR